MIPGPRDVWAMTGTAVPPESVAGARDREGREQWGGNTRISLHQLLPDFAEALRSLQEGSLHEAASPDQLDRHLVTLIEIRVSQIVGSAADVRVHLRTAMKQGQPRRRLHLLAMWRVTDLFDARERAALALVEAVTLGSPLGVRDDVWDEAAGVFSAAELAQIVAVTVATIAANTVALSLTASRHRGAVDDSVVAERSG